MKARLDAALRIAGCGEGGRAQARRLHAHQHRGLKGARSYDPVAAWLHVAYALGCGGDSDRVATGAAPQFELFGVC